MQSFNIGGEWKFHTKLQKYSIWENTTTKIIAEAYQISDGKLCKIHRLRNKPHLVNSLGVINDEENQKMHLLIERIPSRLSSVSVLNECQSLKVLFGVFQGLHEIERIFGHVSILESCVCFNEAGEVKIWMNPDLSADFPIKNMSKVKNAEKRTIEQVISMIEKKCFNKKIVEKIKKCLSNSKITFLEASQQILMLAQSLYLEINEKISPQSNSRLLNRRSSYNPNSRSRVNLEPNENQKFFPRKKVDERSHERKNSNAQFFEGYSKKIRDYLANINLEKGWRQKSTSKPKLSVPMSPNKQRSQNNSVILKKTDQKVSEQLKSSIAQLTGEFQLEKEKNVEKMIKCLKKSDNTLEGEFKTFGNLQMENSSTEQSKESRIVIFENEVSDQKYRKTAEFNTAHSQQVSPQQIEVTNKNSFQLKLCENKQLKTLENKDKKAERFSSYFQQAGNPSETFNRNRNLKKKYSDFGQIDKKYEQYIGINEVGKGEEEKKSKQWVARVGRNETENFSNWSSFTKTNRNSYQMSQIQKKRNSVTRAVHNPV